MTSPLRGKVKNIPIETHQSALMTGMIALSSGFFDRLSHRYSALPYFLHADAIKPQFMLLQIAIENLG